jgi:nitroreductase
VLAEAVVTINNGAGTRSRRSHCEPEDFRQENAMARAGLTLMDVGVERLLLEAATAAPSVLNSQPWQFTVAARRIELYADATRQLRFADSSGRSLLISCGAALFNLRVAADHLGFRPRVRLLPSSSDPTLVATLEVDHAHARPGPLDELYGALSRRRTNRFPFSNRQIPWSVVARLSEAVTRENGLLRVYADPTHVQRLVGALHDAEREERAAPALGEERSAWVGDDRHGDGIPTSALGPRPVDPGTPFRDLAVHTEVRETAAFENTPTVALLSTVFDSPLDWVRAGQALERALLVLTNAGLSASFMNQPLEQAGLFASFMSQPLEKEHLCRPVRSSDTGLGRTHMILRLGYGATPAPPTPRRPISAVLRTLTATQ